MYTYQEVYSFTGERIFVMAFELLLGTVFILVMLAGIQWHGAWVPRLVAALAVVMLLSLAAMNPEGYAAERNMARFKETGKIDPWYLRALSAEVRRELGYDLRLVQRPHHLGGIEVHHEEAGPHLGLPQTLVDGHSGAQDRSCRTPFKIVR